MQPLIFCGGDLREPPNYSFAGQSGNEKRVVVGGRGVGVSGKKMLFDSLRVCNCRLINGIESPARLTSNETNVEPLQAERKGRSRSSLIW